MTAVFLRNPSTLRNVSLAGKIEQSNQSGALPIQSKIILQSTLALVKYSFN